MWPQTYTLPKNSQSPNKIKEILVRPKISCVEPPLPSPYKSDKINRRCWYVFTESECVDVNSNFVVLQGALNFMSNTQCRLKDGQKHLSHFMGKDNKKSLGSRPAGHLDCGFMRLHLFTWWKIEKRILQKTSCAENSIILKDPESRPMPCACLQGIAEKPYFTRGKYADLCISSFVHWGKRIMTS